MDRRTFLERSAIATGGMLIAPVLSAEAKSSAAKGALYERFRTPDACYHPFVRWWWNDDILDADELRRELQLMKQAGIGGVEINPIALPERDNDYGMKSKSLPWLSERWIDMLKTTFDEAKRLGMTCDLLVGSGWPFGAEYLKGEEQAYAWLVNAKELEGPSTYEVSRFALFAAVDPAATYRSPVRTMKLISLTMTPAEMKGLDDVIDLSDQIGEPIILVNVPKGKYFFYAVVQVNAFACVINGAPGASGPILNHMNRQAVDDFLNRMSTTIEKRIGPLKQYMRAMFTDSLELEGSNWTADMREQFRKRRGYDVFPFMPYIMFKTGRLGDVTSFVYGARKTPEFQEELNRVRYDFELTKAELLYERFTSAFTQWCHRIGLLSRMQAYGRGFFPLESSLAVDIPEGESWTTNYLKHRLGEEMGNEDYRRGRGYTMINKFVSSAAHLQGKRLVSCEEMTNTYQVFAATLEFLKLGSDMSIISGITQSFLIGVNYSPPQIPFPGWLRYGAFFSEHNNWWPYMSYFCAYKARISAALQNADMQTDIAIIPGFGDIWSEFGVQTEPFPARLHVPYLTLLWEAVVKNGGGCDYLTEKVLADATVEKGLLCYGPKRYSVVLLPGIKALQPATLAKLYDFVSTGGKLLCLNTYPVCSLGYKDYRKHDAEVTAWVAKLRTFAERFILLQTPADNNLIPWYADVQRRYALPHSVEIEKPDPYFMQNRYRADDGSELFFFTNSRLNERYRGKVTFDKHLSKLYPWEWDLHTGERYRIDLTPEGTYAFDLAPADSRLIVFDRNRKGPRRRTTPYAGADSRTLTGWEVELRHSRLAKVEHTRMEQPVDLKATEYVHFTGTVIYRTVVRVEQSGHWALNLGRVWGVAELRVNGLDRGVRWWGDYVYDLSDCLRAGDNTIEVKVVTTLLNYVKTLTDNPTIRHWAIDANKNQPLSSMGLGGPVTLYGV